MNSLVISLLAAVLIVNAIAGYFVVRILSRLRLEAGQQLRSVESKAAKQLARMEEKTNEQLGRMEQGLVAIQGHIATLDSAVGIVHQSIRGTTVATPLWDGKGNLRRLKIAGPIADEVGQKLPQTQTLADEALDTNLYRVKKGSKSLLFTLVRVPHYYYASSHKSIDITGDWNRHFRELATGIINSETTHLSYDRLYVLWQAVRNVADSQAPILEVGVWRGGSSRFLAEAQRHFHKEGKIYSCDTFEGPLRVTPGLDGAREPIGFDNLDFEEVKKALSAYPDVEIIRGEIEETGPHISDKAIALIHIDVDLHSPTTFILENFAHRLDTHGVIVVDDYGFTSCPGVKQSVDEFVAANSEFQMYHLFTGQAVIVRVAAAPTRRVRTSSQSIGMREPSRAT